MLIAVLFIGVIAVLMAVVFAIVYTYRKLPLHYFLSVWTTFMISLYGIHHLHQRSNDLKPIPEVLQVSSIKYRKREAFGIGPGANEAGIIMYSLKEQVAQQIMKEGMQFFRNIPHAPHFPKAWHQIHTDWSETPLKPSKYWKAGVNADSTYDAYDYICYYISIDVEPTIIKQANQIINEPGSYYAYARIGLIVVSPDKRIVLYMYNG